MKPHMLAITIIYTTILLLITLGYHATESPTLLQSSSFVAGLVGCSYAIAYTIHYGKKEEQ